MLSTEAELFLKVRNSFCVFHKSQQRRSKDERGKHVETDAEREKLSHTGHASVEGKRESAEAQDGRQGAEKEGSCGACFEHVATRRRVRPETVDKIDDFHTRAQKKRDDDDVCEIERDVEDHGGCPCHQKR